LAGSATSEAPFTERVLMLFWCLIYRSSPHKEFDKGSWSSSSEEEVGVAMAVAEAEVEEWRGDSVGLVQGGDGSSDDGGGW